DSTGTHSLYTTYQDYEIMFHVSTMLPYTPNNRQQLLRKRHIGNDIVTIIFQEPGALPFTPQNIRSHFQHVFIIVRAHQPCSENVSYSVAVTRSKDVPPFGPPVPPSGVTFRRSDLFRAFLLAKAINAENAAHKSHKFRTMATRTRQEYLRDLAENYVTNTPLDTAGKFNLISLASKKKEKSKARPLAELESAGAVSWRVSASDFGKGGAEIPCVLGISKEFVVLVDLEAKEVVFNCFTGGRDRVGGAEGTTLRIYHGRGDLVSVRAGAAAAEVKEIVQRLKVTTPGCAAWDMTLRRNGLGQLGFHVHPDGSVAEVEEYGFAWQAGLRRGSRLLEVCKVAAVALSHEQMIDLLRTSVTVTVVIVPPHEDGTPRRGWSESVAEPRADPEPGPRLAPAAPPKRAPAAPAIPHREPQPGHGKRPLSFPESPHSGSSSFRQSSGSFSAPGSSRGERPQRGATFPAEPQPGNSGNSGTSGNSGHSEAAGIGHEGGAERLKAEPLWHVPAPARIPGKRPARPEPGGKDSPNRLPKNEPPPGSHSAVSSCAEAEAGAESRRSPRIPWNGADPGRSCGNAAAPRGLGRGQIPPSAAKSLQPKTPGRAREEPKTQVNVFGQPRLRASLRDLRSPRRLPKSSIEDDLKRLILMDSSCPEPEPAPALQRTLSDESLCGSRRENPGRIPKNPPSREFPENAPGGFGSGSSSSSSSSSTLPARRDGRRGRNSGSREIFGGISQEFFGDFWEFFRCRIWGFGWILMDFHPDFLGNFRNFGWNFGGFEEFWGFGEVWAESGCRIWGFRCILGWNLSRKSGIFAISAQIFGGFWVGVFGDLRNFWDRWIWVGIWVGKSGFGGISGGILSRNSGFFAIFTQIFGGNFGNSGLEFLGIRGIRGNSVALSGPVARLDPGLIPLPDTAGLEWATLVSAAKAYEVQRAVSLFSLTDPALSPEPPPAPPPPERPPRAAPLPPLSPSPAPLDLPGKVSQLEAMLKQLHSDLEKEKQDKVFLQAEVANLRQNNRRLQQESSSAARQLRRFARIFSGAPEHPEP
ncbi:LOW QUALITY PROTEIN: signal-induced proliferation-associated 1-like protein 3, partial [Chamaea fasciata]|uniref:LOW QUALITY PROTEIN: signal-induced proliferation-associated 1-like protein 3 n=1 Tax=Chamaea fasciata TaxID=190680 RepID=UPI00336A1F0B